MLRIQLASMLKISWLFACLVLIHADNGEWDDYNDPDLRGSAEVNSKLQITSESDRTPNLLIKVSADPYTIPSRTTFSATCYIDDYQTQVWWIKDENESEEERVLTSFDTYYESNGRPEVLEIKYASRRDTGNYTCVAKTMGGMIVKERIELRVVVPGRIFPMQQRVSVKNNEPATLSCQVDGYPTSRFSWQYKLNPRDYGVLENNDLEKATEISRTNDSFVAMTLHLENVTVSEHGYYWCIAHDYAKPIFAKTLLNNIVEYNGPTSRYVVFMDPIVVLGANRVYISWLIPGFRDRMESFSFQLQYMNNNTKEWQNHTTKIGRGDNNITLEGLEKSTTYQFRILAVDFLGDSLAPKHSEWVTTMEKDPNFVTTVLIEATTLNSVTFQAVVLPVEMEDQVRYYKAALTHRNASSAPPKYSLYGTSYVVEKLEPNTTYQVKVAGCLNYRVGCGNWSAEQEVVTIDRDPIFVPNISVTDTSRDSITIGWTGPGPDLQDRVLQYKVIATRGDEIRGPVYLKKPADSYVFRNLTPETRYKVKVAACGDYKAQCADWSVEVEGLTEDKAENEQGAIWQSTTATVSILVVVVVVWLVVRNHREKVARQRFMEATLQRFNAGALSSLNPKLNIGDQAELLPYKRKWEFPRELLTLDKVLGSGAFGIVRKAQAKSICRSEMVTTVAVKLVRSSDRVHHITALTRELKILAHLGKHLNVVNLLGACTRNVTYGELLVIVEFCRFGNLRDYLLRRRDDFEDQINTIATTDDIDTSPRISVDPANPTGRGLEARGCENGSVTEDSRQSTDFTITSIPIVDPALGSDSVDPGPPSKYQGDYTDDNLEPISTRDLVCWSWQISRGMKYLGSRRILHGDLAARNVLLADRNVVKICDFGLAKALYSDDNYTKKGHGPLPVKWMAIESLRDRVFSVQSDVWSYGIVLWELFTLSETPYPGITNENVYQKLVEGFRLTKPKYATDDTYRTMLRCWDAEPKKRPSFEELENILVELLDEGVKTHYLDLGAPYAQMNADDLKLGERDYLTMGPSDDASNAMEQVLE